MKPSGDDRGEALERFSKDVARAERGLAALSSDPSAFSAALRQLQEQYAELCVADEELHAQVDELARLSLARDIERQRSRELFDFAPDPYLVSDTFGLISEANVAASELFGAAYRDIRGKTLAMFVDRDDRERLRDFLARVLRTGRAEAELTLAAGVRPTCDISLVGATSADGDRILWTARVLDHWRSEATRAASSEVVRRKGQLEQELAETRAKLAAERSRREALEESHRTKDHFLAVLAHDLRSPLNAVLGWTEILGREALDPDRRTKALAVIERNTRVQAELVNELLDVARLGSDQLNLKMEPLDLGELARRSVEALAPSAEKKGVHLQLEVDAGTHAVLADAGRLDQVVSNLLSNALSYTPAGGSILVEVAEQGPSIALSVRDTGAGIDESDLPWIFDRHRARRPSHDGSHGLGLGLNIVAQLIKLHGGRVKADSEGPGRGATFTVVLPSSEAATRATGDVPIAFPDELHGLKVMVVEDDPDTLDLLKGVFSRFGATVTACTDAWQARHDFERETPDILISDLGLPDKDGFTLMREIREELHSAVPAIAVSAYARAVDVADAKAAGFAAHVAKPVDPYALVSLVSNALRPTS